MKPFKAGIPLASWLLRIALVTFIFWKFLNVVKTLDFKELEFYLAALFLFFGALLFIGGVLSKESLSIFSAFVLFIIGTYTSIMAFNAGANERGIIFAVATSISFYFLCVGNKN